MLRALLVLLRWWYFCICSLKCVRPKVWVQCTLNIGVDSEMNLITLLTYLSVVLHSCTQIHVFVYWLWIKWMKKGIIWESMQKVCGVENFITHQILMWNQHGIRYNILSFSSAIDQVFAKNPWSPHFWQSSNNSYRSVNNNRIGKKYRIIKDP